MSEVQTEDLTKLEYQENINQQLDPQINQWISFIEAFCDVEDPASMLNKKAWSRIESGMCPVDAFCLQEIESLKKKIIDISTEIKNISVGKRNIEKSPGSVSNLYASQPIDPFIDGLLTSRKK